MSDTKCFIGRNVTFDTVYPENISLGKRVHITAGVTFLTHYMNPSRKGFCFDKGNVVVGDDVFIGVGSIITKPVKIGNRAVIGAGSIVTKDIPADEIWAGNPARFIKKREYKE